MRSVLLLSLLASGVAAAQPAAPERLTWATLAVGASSGNSEDPWRPACVSVAADFHVVRGPVHVQAGASSQGTILGADRVSEGHVAAGTARTFGPGVVTASVGPSLAYVSRSHYGTPASPVTGFAGRTEGFMPGLYASVGAAVVLVPEVAFGVEAFGHLNARTPVAGLRLTTGLGRLPRSVVR